MLDGLGERAGTEWFGIADRQLEVSLTAYESARDLIHAIESEGSFSSSEATALAQLRDELAGAWVEVRMSGRGDHQTEMLDLVEDLLSDG